MADPSDPVDPPVGSQPPEKGDTSTPEETASTPQPDRQPESEKSNLELWQEGIKAVEDQLRVQMASQTSRNVANEAFKQAVGKTLAEGKGKGKSKDDPGTGTPQQSTERIQEKPLLHRWDTNTLSAVPWDGSVSIRDEVPLGSQKHTASYTEWFWGGTAVIVTILALVFWGLLFIAAWGFYFVWVYRAPWFHHLSRTTRRVFKGAIDLAIGLVLLILWLAVPSPFKSQTQTERQPERAATVQPTPTPTASPAPSIVRKASPVASYFNGRVRLTRGEHRLYDVLRASGYDGSWVLETLEFYNPSDVEVCWRVRSRGARCITNGDGYNFPGGADASLVWLRVEQDAMLDIGVKSK